MKRYHLQVSYLQRFAFHRITSNYNNTNNIVCSSPGLKKSRSVMLWNVDVSYFKI